MRRLGRYTLGPIIGRGGAGTVHRATLHGPEGRTRPVALKVLHKEAGLLQREARLTGLLRHRNLVDVYDIGEVNGTWFCALELCEGALDGRPPLSPRAVVEVGLQICDVLAYANRELGLVHLDLKPANLLIGDGGVKVADLGIAAAAGFERRWAVSGTPRYMSPEQHSGGPLDSRSDIYSLGVTLRDLALGQEACQRTPAVWTPAPKADTTWDGQTLDQPADFGVPSVHCPGWLEAVFNRCTQADPALRYASMEALADALRALDVTGPGLIETFNLAPSPTTLPRRTCIGRDTELDAVDALLAVPGLITLHGPGGVGKTCLADAIGSRWPGAVRFCSLAGVTDRLPFVQEVARQLNMPLPSEGDPIQHVGAALSAHPGLLLILDNVEQLVAHASVIEQWCTVAHTLRVLVTSRTLLGLAQEQVVPVTPLAPKDAVKLLADAALARGVEANNDELVELAARLDHLPLALLLAAGRMGVLSTQEIRDRLAPTFLRSGGSDRHATMQSALDGSWALLDEAERTLLGELTVFRGGFDLHAVEAVSASGDVIDRLDQLERHALLSTRSDRLNLLELIRTHAAAQIGTCPAVERRHGLYYARLGSLDSLLQQGSRAGEQRYRQVQRDRANIAIAAERALARGDAAVAVGTIAASNLVSFTLGPLPPALTLTRRLLALPGLSPRQRCRGLLMLAEVTRMMHQLEEARQAAEAAHQLAEADGDPRLIWLARFTLGDVLLWSYALDEAHAVYSGLLDATAPARRGRALYRLGILALSRGQQQQAQHALEDALHIFRTLGNRRYEADVLSSLSNVQFEQGQVRQSCITRAAAMTRFRELGDQLAEVYAASNQAATLHAFDREAARSTYMDALAMSRRLGTRRHAASIKVNLGTFLMEQGEQEGATKYFTEALDYFDAAGDRRWRAVCLWLRGLQLLHHEELDTALSLTDRIDADGVAIGDAVTKGRAAVLRGRVALARGLPAVALLREASTHLKDAQVVEWGSTQAWLAEALRIAGDSQAGLDCANTAVQTLTQANHLTGLSEALCLRARVRASLGDDEAFHDLTHAQELAEGMKLGPNTPLGVELAHTARVLRESHPQYATGTAPRSRTSPAKDASNGMATQPSSAVTPKTSTRKSSSTPSVS